MDVTCSRVECVDDLDNQVKTFPSSSVSGVDGTARSVERLENGISRISMLGCLNHNIQNLKKMDISRCSISARFD